MAYVVDVEEPWIANNDVSTYDAEGFADMKGVTVEIWVEHLHKITAEKGGAILYEGDPEQRPAWLRERFAAAKRK